MKRISLRHLFIFLFILPYTLAIGAVEKYTLDPQHSFVLWHIDHFGFSTPSGKWMAQGVLALDEQHPENSQVTVTIPVAELVTGIPELDKHLKEKLFFDVAQFPTATFTSDHVKTTGKNTATIHGMLTLHGITKPITLAVKLNKIGENPISNKMSAGFSATAKIKRSDFGINTLLPGVGDEVTLEIQAEAYK